MKTKRRVQKGAQKLFTIKCFSFALEWTANVFISRCWLGYWRPRIEVIIKFTYPLFCIKPSSINYKLKLSMNVTISFEPSINFCPGLIRVITLQNFPNSGVLSPDFETFIVAAETYVLFRLLNILWGQFYFHGMVRIVNCIQNYFVRTSFEKKKPIDGQRSNRILLTTVPW